MYSICSLLTKKLRMSNLVLLLVMCSTCNSAYSSEESQFADYLSNLLRFIFILS